MLDYKIIDDVNGKIFSLNPQFIAILFSNFKKYDFLAAVSNTVKSFANEATVIEKAIICAFVADNVNDAHKAMMSALEDVLPPHIKKHTTINKHKFKNFDDIMEHIKKEKLMK